MKLNWRTHTNSIGYFYFSGCFRCHVGPEGKVVKKDCDFCHTILDQEEGGVNVASAPVSLAHQMSGRINT